MVRGHLYGRQKVPLRNRLRVDVLYVAFVERLSIYEVSLVVDLYDISRQPDDTLL